MIDSCKETMTLSAEEKRQHDRFAKRVIASASVGEEEKPVLRPMQRKTNMN